LLVRNGDFRARLNVTEMLVRLLASRQVFGSERLRLKELGARLAKRTAQICQPRLSKSCRRKIGCTWTS